MVYNTVDDLSTSVVSVSLQYSIFNFKILGANYITLAGSEPLLAFYLKSTLS